MRAFLRWLVIPSVLLGGLLLGPVRAASIAPEVRDEAGFFSPDAVRRANEVIQDIERDFKKDLLIETFPTVPADRAEEFKKLDSAGRKKFFSDWAIERARAAKVNGVYIMLVKNPGHLQVEVGQETRKKAFTTANREELEERMLKKLREAAKAPDEAAKKKIHDEALLDAVRYVYNTMKANGAGSKVEHPAAGNVGERSTHLPPANVPPHRPASPAGIGLGGILCWGLLIVGIAWVVIGLIRAFTGGMGGGGGYGPGGMMGGGMGGGGGFMTGLLGGLFGAAAGSWLYDRFFRGDSWGGGGMGGSAYGSDAPADQPRDTDYSGSGGDFDGRDDGGGGGGDFGGGDAGGGGGDFGGGGGDFGGGGGDFGGGGGDFGGGGGGGDF